MTESLRLTIAQNLRQCETCKNLRHESDYYLKFWRGKQYPERTCKFCRRERTKQRKAIVHRRRAGAQKPPTRLNKAGMTGRERYAMAERLKNDAGCADCRKADAPRLQFDHLPGTPKLFNVSEALWRTGYFTDQQIDDEIAKCEVVCHPCHVNRTRLRRLGLM